MKYVEFAFLFNDAQIAAIADVLDKGPADITERDLRNYIVDRVQGRGTFAFGPGMAAIRRVEYPQHEEIR